MLSLRYHEKSIFFSHMAHRVVFESIVLHFTSVQNRHNFPDLMSKFVKSVLDI